MMKHLRFVFSIWVAVAIYGFASITIGRTGIIAMQGLEAERDRLSTNMDRLRAINGELELSVVALQSDADTIAVRARELGYGKPDERFVRIVGLPAAGRRAETAGNLLSAVRPEGVSDTAIRILSVCAGLVAFAFSSLAGSVRRARD